MFWSLLAAAVAVDLIVAKALEKKRLELRHESKRLARIPVRRSDSRRRVKHVLRRDVRAVVDVVQRQRRGKWRSLMSGGLRDLLTLSAHQSLPVFIERLGVQHSLCATGSVA